jgi:hypothetical protein
MTTKTPEAFREASEAAKKVQELIKRLQFLTEEAQSAGSFPKGFIPVFDHRDDKSVIRENIVCLPTKGVRGGDGLVFEAEGFKVENLPVLPLRGHGEIWSVGWDIPVQWAIDANGRAWKDFAHGGAMTACTEQELLSEARIAECHQTLETLHALFGKKPPMPAWMRAALSAGWTPPMGFNRSDYET